MTMLCWAVSLNFRLVDPQLLVLLSITVLSGD